MTDRELLEAAAGAAGLVVESWLAWGGAWVYPKDAPMNGDGEPPIRIWNPLADNGDALRLAVNLRLDLEFQDGSGVEVYRNCLHNDSGDKASHCTIEYGSDLADATRRAIVRAAAEIGTTKKGAA